MHIKSQTKQTLCYDDLTVDKQTYRMFIYMHLDKYRAHFIIIDLVVEITNH